MTNRTGIDFLVVGAGRGGTSLLAGLLDAHPGLEVGFEHRSVATLMGHDVKERGPGLFDARVAAFLGGCRTEAARFPGRLWGNKITTEQILGLEDRNLEHPDAPPIDVLDRFFNEALAGVPVVFLLRDGRTCVRSKVRRTGQSVAQACERWRYSVDVWRFFRDCHLRNLTIRFEDLVRQPRETMETVCDFLDVSWCEEMLTGTRSAKMLPEYRRAGVDEGPAALGDVPREVEETLGHVLAECGYLPRTVVSPRVEPGRDPAAP
ncbi:sulfotransferase [bacterium]|nr:sulfotransferase [bacterium]